MRVRYEGPDEARDVAVPGGFLHCPSGEWVDLAAACDETGIPVHHAELATLGLAGQAGWTVELDEHTPLERPADSAVKKAWVAYAVEQGMEPDLAQASTRNQLAALYPVDDQETQP